MNPHYTQISMYVILTAIVIFILSRVADHAGDIFMGIGRGLHWLWGILKPLVIGFFFAYLLFPLRNFFIRRFSRMKWFEKRHSDGRGVAVALTVLIALGAVALLLGVVVSTFSHEITVMHVDDITAMVSSFAKTLKDFVNNIGNWLESFNISSTQVRDALNNVTSAANSYVARIGNQIVSSLSGIVGFFSSLIFAIIFMIYFLLDSTNLYRYWGRVVRAFAGKHNLRWARQFLADADQVFSGYIRGQLMDALFMLVVVSIALSLVGVRFAVIIGILTGVGNLIPYVGPFVAYGSTILVCLMNGDFEKLIIALIVIFVIQTIDGNVINPKFLSQSINIHPMLVIVALLVGSAIGGILGMLMAVPIAGLLKLQFERLVEFRLARQSQVVSVSAASHENASAADENAASAEADKTSASSEDPENEAAARAKV